MKMKGSCRRGGEYVVWMSTGCFCKSRDTLLYRFKAGNGGIFHSIISFICNIVNITYKIGNMVNTVQEEFLQQNTQ